MEKPLHPIGRRTLGQVLLRKFVHGRNKGRDRGDRLKGVAVRLAFVEAGVSIERGQHQERKHGSDQHQQWQVGEIGQGLEHVQAIHRVVQDPVRRPEAHERDSRLHQNALENMAVHMVAEFVRQNRLNFVGRSSSPAAYPPE